MTFSTEIAHLPDGNHICYTDSGVPQDGGPYTSIVMLHGTAFNSHVFEPLHELAAKYRLRLFAIQRRGYVGSSPYSEAELNDLQKGDPVFLDRLVALQGHLIAHLIKKHGLPEPNADRTAGGIALLAWSMGCATAVTFFSDPRLFEKNQYDLLRRYLRKFVLYGEFFQHQESLDAIP